MLNKDIIHLDQENNFLAHVDYKTKRVQSMKQHAENVSMFSKSICPLPELKNMAKLIGILHDAGKLGTENQNDFKNILEYGDMVHKHGLDHSTAGGRITRELIESWSVSEFISAVIYFHHGLED